MAANRTPGLLAMGHQTVPAWLMGCSLGAVSSAQPRPQACCGLSSRDRSRPLNEATAHSSSGELALVLETRSPHLPH